VRLRRYLRYVVQMAVHEDTNSTNKRNYDITLGSVLRHNFALSALFLPRYDGCVSMVSVLQAS